MILPTVLFVSKVLNWAKRLLNFNLQHPVEQIAGNDYQ